MLSAVRNTFNGNHKRYTLVYIMASPSILVNLMNVVISQVCCPFVLAHGQSQILSFQANMLLLLVSVG